MSNFSFGSPATNPPATLSFGASSNTSGFNFGTPTASVAPQPQQQVAPQPQQSTSFGFGTTPSFGQPANPTTTAPPAFSFGTSTPASSTQLSFGTTPQITPQQPTALSSTGFGFGQAGVTAPPAFGATQQPGSLSFGQPTASLFSTPTSSVPATLSFLPTTSAPAFGSSITLTTANQPTLLGLGAPATTAPPSFGFGTSTSLTTTSVNTLGSLATTSTFGKPATSTVPSFPSLGGFGVVPPTSTFTPGITPLATVEPKTGLGGIDTNLTQPKAVEGKNETTKVKESQIPKEIIANVDSLRAHVKQQKTLSSDIARTSTRKLFNVTNDIKTIQWNIQEAAHNVDSNQTAIKMLRNNTGNIIHQTDMAQRTHETPAGSQFENTLPQQYFVDLIKKYENELLTLKVQVEQTEKHLHFLSNPQNFTAQDLKRGLQQIHESFIALTGRLQESHQKIEVQKEQYLNLRKYLLRDTTNVFGDVQEETQQSSTKISFGPNPFTSLTNMTVNQNSSLSSQWSNQTGTTQPPAANTSSFFGQSNIVGNSANSVSFASPSADTFNLQKPLTIGIKRNKS